MVGIVIVMEEIGFHGFHDSLVNDGCCGGDDVILVGNNLTMVSNIHYGVYYDEVDDGGGVQVQEDKFPFFYIFYYIL